MRKAGNRLRIIAQLTNVADDFYLRGRKFFYQAQRKDIEFAREMFSRAIKKDPELALAYAGIADCCSWLFMYVESSQDNLEQSLTASQKALELDPTLAEAHSAHGLVVSLNKRYDEAENEFETAIQLNPQLFEAYYFFACTCFMQGKLEKAANLFELACKTSPEDYQAPLLLANTYHGLHRVQEARLTCRRGLQIVERHLDLNPDDARALYLGAHALIVIGEPEKGLQWADRALAIDADDPVILYDVACAYSLARKIEKAMDYLAQSLQCGYTSKEWIAHDSYLDAVRGQERFQTLYEKL